MADDIIKNVGIRVTTTAAGDGAEVTAAKLERVTEATVRLTDASMLLTAEEAAGQQAIMALNDQIAALEAKKNAVLNDRTPRIIDATTAAGAAASPDNQVAAIEREIAATEAEILATRKQIAGTTTQQVITEEKLAEMKAASAKIDAEAAVEKEKQLANTMRQASIEAEIIAMRQAQKELAIAKAAGDDLEVEKLTAEINIRKMTVAELHQELATRAELVEIEDGQAALLNDTLETIQARVAARQLEVETAEAQEALNTELIAQEEARLALENEIVAAQEALNAALVEEEAARLAAAAAEEKVYGMRNRYASLLRNVGLDQNMAASVGIGLFGGYEAYEAIHRFTEELKKANEERDKASAKELESHAHAMREIGDLGSLSEAQRRRSEAVEKLNEALDQQRNLGDDATEEQRSQIDSRISDMEVEIAAIDRANVRTLAREDAARKVKEQEEATRDALNEQLKALDREEQANSRRLEFEKQKNALIAENAIKQLEVDVASGRTTPEEAARQRAGITTERDKKDFDSGQKKLDDEIEIEKKKPAATTKKASDHRAQVEAATKAQQDADDKRADLQKKSDDAARLEEAAKVAANDAAAAQERANTAGLGHAGPAGYMPSAEEMQEQADERHRADHEAEEARRKATEAQKAADDARAIGPRGGELEKANAEAAIAAKTLEEAKSAQTQLDKTNKDAVVAAAQRIQELNEQKKAQAELNALKEAGDKLDSQAREAKAAAEEKKKHEEAAKQDFNQQVETFRTKFADIHAQKSGQASDYKKLSEIVQDYQKSHGDLSVEQINALKRLDDSIKFAISENEKRKAEIKHIGHRANYNAP